MKLSKYLLVIPAGILFGKLLPVLFLAAIFIGIAVIVKAAIIEGNK